MKAIVLLFFTLTILTSCGKAPTAEVRVTGSMAMTGTAFSGGAVLLATTVINDKVETFSIPMDYGEITFNFPLGKYNIMTLGWDGNNPMTGTLFCDAKEGLDIKSDGDLKFVLTQVATGNVINTKHPCETFIEGDLFTMESAKFCSEKNTSETDGCGDTNNYIRKGVSPDDNNMTIRYGLIGYQGPPIHSRPFWNEPKFTSNTSKCILTDYISNHIDGENTDIAKVDFSTPVGGIILPRRLKKGLRLPIAFGIYEHDTNTTDCGYNYFKGAAVLGNSVGEKKTDDNNRHYVNSSFIYRLPTEDHEYTPFDGITLITSYGTDKVYEITNHGKKKIELVPDLTGITSFNLTGSTLICSSGDNCKINILPLNSTTDIGSFNVTVTDEETGEVIETETIHYKLNQ